MWLLQSVLMGISRWQFGQAFSGSLASFCTGALRPPDSSSFFGWKMKFRNGMGRYSSIMVRSYAPEAKRGSEMMRSCSAILVSTPSMTSSHSAARIFRSASSRVAA